MVWSTSQSGNLVWLWLSVVCLFGASSATLAQNPASYKGIQKDAFMRRCLVLGAISTASESASKPDEESQKKAFSTDWLAPHGGETGIVTVTREGNQLFAQMTGQPKFEIFPSSATEFFWKVVNAKIAFVKNEGGKVTKAIHEQGGPKLEVSRFCNSKPVLSSN